jgi:hypothetical protein
MLFTDGRDVAFPRHHPSSVWQLFNFEVGQQILRYSKPPVSYKMVDFSHGVETQKYQLNTQKGAFDFGNMHPNF